MSSLEIRNVGCREPLCIKRSLLSSASNAEMCKYDEEMGKFLPFLFIFNYLLREDASESKMLEL